MKSSEALASKAPPTKSICSACCFDVRVVVPSSRRLATRFASPALSGGSCAEPALISAWISTMGRKCCSRTSTVMPFVVINFVGAISAASLEPLARSKRTQSHHAGQSCLSSRRGPESSSSTSLGPSLLRGGGGRLWLFGRQGYQCADGPIVFRQILASDTLNIFSASPLGSVRQIGLFFATRHRQIQPARATSHAGSWSPVRRHGWLRPGSLLVAVLALSADRSGDV